MHQGVELNTTCAGKAPKRYIHMRHDTWCITSDTPPNEQLLSCDHLERCLPGYLGAYFYPKDAVFHFTDRAETTQAHFSEILSNERERGRMGVVHGDLTQLKLNHLTFVHEDTSIGNEIVNDDEEEEVVEGEGEGEEDDVSDVNEEDKCSINEEDIWEDDMDDFPKPASK